MQARVLTPPSIDLQNSSIKIVIAYENAATARRAEAIYDRLAQRLGDDFDFEQRLWRFDVLEEENLRAEAAKDTADADIVIVATNADNQLPHGVQSWLESSLRQHAGGAALVALLEHPSPPVQPYLEDVARRGGMDFFAQSSVDNAPVELPLLSAEDPRPRPHRN